MTSVETSEFLPQSVAIMGSVTLESPLEVGRLPKRAEPTSAEIAEMKQQSEGFIPYFKVGSVWVHICQIRNQVKQVPTMHSGAGEANIGNGLIRDNPIQDPLRQYCRRGCAFGAARPAE